MVANRKNPDQNPKISQLKIFKISKIENRKSQNRKSKIFKISKMFFLKIFFFDDKKNLLRFFFRWWKKSWDFFLEIFFLRFWKFLDFEILRFWKFWDFSKFFNLGFLIFHFGSNKKIYTKYFDFGFLAKIPSPLERSEKPMQIVSPTCSQGPSEHSVRS